MKPRTIIVTGASRGIGRGIVRTLAAEGNHIIGVYHVSDDDAQSLEREVPNVQCYKADLSRREDITALLAKLPRGGIGGLVNNAGVIEFESPDNYDIGIWDRTLALNVTCPLLLSIGVAPRMLEDGAIVNIASTDGLTGSFTSMAYAASKAALINLTKSLANNLGKRGIRVNAVSPGWINTGMSTPASFEAAGLTPLARNGTPEDVASVVSFLLSDRARFVTGANYLVDGGYTNVDYIMRKEASGS